ncbi:SMI1/KNR4 family protein [Nocardia salmonicida]|uniref:SMI1/KNR4 family protein n=1 Tax=Nocardia salmonicida TaxID=53431 RepID=UPI002E29FFD8|nr:SMI1/KNR4 family protein [Nocardia salmonicida]
MARFELGTFDQAWDRFLALLATYSSATRAALRPAATSDEIARLEADLGFALHPDLRALLERHNGVVETQYGGFVERTGAFLPMGYQLLDISKIASDHRFFVKEGVLNREFWPEEHLWGHMHQWAPIARSIDAGVLFIDHRPGPTYGHVYEAGIGSGATDGTLWGSSLTEFVTALADALDTRSTFRSDYFPEVRRSDLSGSALLHWHIDWL